MKLACLTKFFLSCKQKLREARLRTKLILFAVTLFFIQAIFLYVNISYLFSTEYKEINSNSTLTSAKIIAQTKEIIDFMESEEKDIASIDTILTIVNESSNLNFIVLLDMQGMRLYHPVKENIGKHVVGGDEIDVLQGKTYTSSAQGTLGYSYRAFVPVYGSNGTQIGAVLTGSLSESIDSTIMQLLSSISPAFIFLLLSSVLVAIFLSREIIKILHNMEPSEIASRLEERNTMLRVMREGAIAIDKEGRITLVNDEAMRIFQKSGIVEWCIGKNVEQVIPNTRLKDVLISGHTMLDEEQNVNGTIIYTHRVPIYVQGHLVGALATFRDMTELNALAEKLTNVNMYVDGMRAQSHEIRNRLHILSGFAKNEKYDELLAYLQELLGMREQDEERINHNIKDSMIGGFLSSKVHKAKEFGVHFCFEEKGVIPEIQNQRLRNHIITILGNLIDNALDAMENSKKKVLSVSLSFSETSWRIKVCDTGKGIPQEIQSEIFKKDFSTKGNGRGLGLYLVVLAVDECDGTFELCSTPDIETCITINFPRQKVEFV